MATAGPSRRRTHARMADEDGREERGSEGGGAPPPAQRVRRTVEVEPRRNAHREIIPEPDNQECFRRTMRNLFVSNTVVTVELDVTNLDLEAIARDRPAVIFHRETFAALRMNLRSPRSTCLVYPMGEIVCMASKSGPQAIRACWLYVRLLNHFGVPCMLKSYRCDNVVSSVLSFPLDLDKLARLWPHAVTYEPDNFPGARLKCDLLGIKTDISMALFDSGKINHTGSKGIEDTCRVMEEVYWTVLVKIRVRGDRARGRARARTGATAARARAGDAFVYAGSDNESGDGSGDGSGDESGDDEEDDEEDDAKSDDSAGTGDSDSGLDDDDAQSEGALDRMDTPGQVRRVAKRTRAAAEQVVRRAHDPSYNANFMNAVHRFTDIQHFGETDPAHGVTVDKIMASLTRRRQF